MALPLPLHALWRKLPVGARRRLFSGLTGALAPRPDRTPSAARGGLAVAGEVSQASGLGESARLIHRAAASLGLPSTLIDFGAAAPGDRRDASLAAGVVSARAVELPPGVPLLLHTNPATLPWLLLRARRDLVRQRRVIGYWMWELPAVPPGWAGSLRFVHEIWTSSALLRRRHRDAARHRATGHPDPRGRPAARARPAPALRARTVPRSACRNGRDCRPGVLQSQLELRAQEPARRHRRVPRRVRGPPRPAARPQAAECRPASRRHGRWSEPPSRGPPTSMSIAARCRRPTAHALTACADIVLSLHRSEGFGLVPAEAMLLGRVPWSRPAGPGTSTSWTTTARALVPVPLVPVVDPRRSTPPRRGLGRARPGPRPAISSVSPTISGSPGPRPARARGRPAAPRRRAARRRPAGDRAVPAGSRRHAA